MSWSVGLSACSDSRFRSRLPGTIEPPPPPYQVFNVDQVNQLVQTHCLSCHSAASPGGGVSFEGITTEQHWRESGYIVPGSPDQSKLIQSLSGQGRMPLGNTTGFTDQNRVDLTVWVSQLAAAEPSYRDRALSVLNTHCISCHATPILIGSGDTVREIPPFTTLEDSDWTAYYVDPENNRQSFRYISPGRPEESRLLFSLKHNSKYGTPNDRARVMPPEATEAWREEDFRVLEEWVIHYNQEQGLGRRAFEIVRENCAQCHGPDSPGLSRRDGHKFDYIFDEQRMIAEGLIRVVDGQRSASGEFLSLLSRDVLEERHMPVNGYLSAQDRDELRAWVLTGDGFYGKGYNEVPPRSSRTEQQWVTLAQSDLASLLNPQDIRYLSFDSLYRSGASQAELDQARRALSKFVNSISWNKNIVRPGAVDDEKILFRIRLSDYQWTAADWSELEAAYPYRRSGVSELSATGTTVGIMRADWFLSQASDPSFYHRFAQIDENMIDLAARLGVDINFNVQEIMSPGFNKARSVLSRAVRAGLRNSGVSFSNRMMERHPVSASGDHNGGAFWVSYDFADEDQEKEDIFDFPVSPAWSRDGGFPSLFSGLGFLGSFRVRSLFELFDIDIPSIGENAQFEHDGGEVIFSLPNGLHGYMLTLNTGNRISAGPMEIVVDRGRADRNVINGISCFSCHFDGMIRKYDEVGAFVAGQSNADQSLKTYVNRLYASQASMNTVYDVDNTRYQSAMAEAEGLVVDRAREGAEEVSTVVMRYQNDLNMRQAMLELDLSERVLRGRVESVGRASCLIELAAYNGSVNNLNSLLGPLAEPPRPLKQVFSEFLRVDIPLDQRRVSRMAFEEGFLTLQSQVDQCVGLAAPQ